MRKIIEFLSKLKNWLIRTFKWLIIEPKLFWIMLLPFIFGYTLIKLIPIGILNTPFNCDTLDFRFRLIGLLLELFGICTVVYGLNEAFKFFEHTALLDIIVKWFKRFPKFFENHILVGSANIQENFSDSCNGIITTSANPNTSFENRISILEQQYNKLFIQVQNNRTHFTSELKKFSSDLNTEINQRIIGDKHNQQTLKEFAVRDVYIELVGIIWLLFGAISATASTELAKYFG